MKGEHMKKRKRTKMTLAEKVMIALMVTQLIIDIVSLFR